MKHFAKYVSMLVTVMLLAVSFVSCGGGDDDDDEPNPGPNGTTLTLNEQLVGYWTETNLEDGETPYILILNANQTGTISFTVSSNAPSRVSLSMTQSFKWTAGTGANGLNFMTILTTGGDMIIEDGNYTLSVIGDDLSLGGLRFKRN